MHSRELKGQYLLVSAVVAALIAPRLEAQELTDSAFHAMQARGKEVMGVDQMTSTHRFTPLPTGGQITFVRDSSDSAGTGRIRAHLREMQRAFSAGDFSRPMLIHMKTVPGVSVMAARHSLINYTERDIPRGGELLIVTDDSASIAAVHEFLAFQRGEHRAGS